MQEEDSLDKVLTMTEENDEIGLQRGKLQMKIDVVVNNIMTSVDYGIILTLQSCLAESRPSPVCTAASTSIMAVVDG